MMTSTINISFGFVVSYRYLLNSDVHNGNFLAGTKYLMELNKSSVTRWEVPRMGLVSCRCSPLWETLLDGYYYYFLFLFSCLLF